QTTEKSDPNNREIRSKQQRNQIQTTEKSDPNNKEIRSPILTRSSYLWTLPGLNAQFRLYHYDTFLDLPCQVFIFFF
ncbi:MULTISPECIES: hypothetical protein, partial [unclassified Bartonella]|uniref:hypothetical protein n=1 Tax=unclassified Bartonella TaxID=2645622 RepID=UPI0035D0FD5F